MIVKWIPIDEDLPEVKPCGDGYQDSNYLLLSFANFNIPQIGRYVVDPKGDGYFVLGDEDEPLSKIDVYVNAWMELIPPYREGADERS